MRILQRFSGFAHKSTDSSDLAFKKLLILSISLSCCAFGIIWSAMYYVVFGMGLTMILPLCFVVIVGSVIIISHRIADHRPLIYAQLICITWISALIQWSIGSMDQSGLVIAWSFLGPLGALIFLSSRQAILWMVMFIVIVIVSAFLEPSLLGYNQTVSDQTRNLFYILNLGVSATVVFAASVWFVGTIQIERGRSEILLQKIRALFGQHVSREVANELISHGKEESGSRAYEVTIMFLDIRDFTILADSRAPNEVATLQNTVFSELINIVRANKGIVIQILGDGIMAVFGAPVVSDTHENDAVIAGYDMIEIIKELTIQGKIPSIRVGIGLHAGKVIAGEVGNEYRKLYSLAGSNVIIAARIEQLNKDLNSQFLISETVYQKINHLENTMTFLGLKNLKGISNSIGIYQLA
jgi:class 3 adenylate cyclase